MANELVFEGIDFGEGPRWHDGRLWFSDFYQHKVRAVTPAGEVEVVASVPGQPSGLGWLPDGRLLIVSMSDRKVLRLDAGELALHADLAGIATAHCNDMVVSATGHAYVGNFGSDILSGAEPVAAKLALVHPDGRTEVAAEGLEFPNGSVITPDGTTLIVGETIGARYTAFDIGDDGQLSGRRVWAELPGHFPDGCSLDAGGGIWFADAGGKGCLRAVEGGEITNRIETDQTPYACALGGDDGRTLFILTAPTAAAGELTGKGLGRLEMTRVEHPHAGLP
ncbi:MAG: SMP-30/gluconolactonase/LRE family protein [Deltaproteobacteria bacterium]|nr:SMP-30/gluconolactonase/LRE family protein [Deltaproteobacteria bacterium]